MPSRKQQTGTAWFIDPLTRALQLALTEYQSLEGLSDHALAERINEETGDGQNKESIRRFLKGEQRPTRKRMESVKAFLAGVNKSAARALASEERAQEAVRFTYGGIPASCRPKALGTGAVVEELVLGRFGFPLEIDGDSGNPAREMHDALARNILTLTRIEGETDRQRSGPAAPAESGAAALCAAGDVEGEDA